MRFVRAALFLLLVVGGGLTAGAQYSTDAGLILDHTESRPGETVMAGLRLRMAPGWHTYWRNPGDEVGKATKIDWTLPPGIKAGEIQWPVPEKSIEKEYHTLTYSSEVMLLVPLEISKEAAAGAVELKAKVRWLECKEECVPGNATVSARLVIGAVAKPSDDAVAFETAKARLPKAGADLKPEATWEGDGGDERPLVISWRGAEGATEFDFYPFDVASGAAKTSVKTERVESRGGTHRIRKTVTKADGGWPTSVMGLLVPQPPPPGGSAAFVVAIPVGEGIAKEPREVSTTPNVPAPVPLGELLLKLLSAFVGGLILNIMPCVLPVLALKVFGFVNQAKEAPGRVRVLGLVYGAGVLVSFLVLAGVAIGIQRAGGTASWSTPFQNPISRVLITVLITLVALNLFGVYEITLGGSAMQAAGDLAAQDGASGAFFNGVLAAVLATPCTAPFLASAVAFAFLQPPIVIMLFFLAIGGGLAAPFVLLCWQPAWLRYLPKPGAWMVRFKVAMGFPMLATAIWLFWFTAGRLGEPGSGVLWFGLFLVTIAAAVWVWGEFVQRSVRRRGLGAAIALGLLAFAYFGLLEHQLDWRTPQAKQRRAIEWRTWSHQAVAQARKEGHPVLVDFTADSCLNCKWNKKVAIDVESTRARLKALNVVAFEADFTDADPVIAEELKKHGRRGVPLVLVYSKVATRPAEELPQVLTATIVQEALDRAAQ